MKVVRVSEKFNRQARKKKKQVIDILFFIHSRRYILFYEILSEILLIKTFIYTDKHFQL